MDGVSRLIVNSKEILVVDYSNCRETEMIKRLTYAKELALAENRPIRLLNVFNEKCFITPTFMRHAENIYTQARHLVERHAVIGLSTVQKMILKGFNLFADKKLHNFNTREESIFLQKKMN